MRKIRHSLFLLLAFNCWNVSAQINGYHYTAKLNSVAADGFYNIALTPSVHAHTKIDFSDLRVVNNSGKWMPHLITQPATAISSTSVVWNLNFVVRHGNNATTLMVTAKDTITTNLILQMANAVAQRFCVVTGSYDARNWFSVNDSVLIVPTIDDKSSNAIFQINFPPSNYKYFNVAIYDHSKKPLHIKSVKTAGAIASASNYQLPVKEPNPVSHIIQKDSASSSYIKVTQPLSYHFNSLWLNVSGAKYFNRLADVYVPISANHSFSNPGKLIHSFTLSNNSTLQYNLPAVYNAPVFYLVIRNQDNPPLLIKSIKTFSPTKFATVYLQAKKQYRLAFGNPTAVLPNYDLSLTDIGRIDSMPTLVADKAMVMTEEKAAAKPTGESTKIIWLIIILVGLVLAYFTYRLVAELNTQNNITK
jgi:hypothetical protein